MRATIAGLLLSVVFAAVAIAPPARAETVRVCWTNATTNTDGSPIPATGAGSLTRTTVEYGTRNSSAFGMKAGEVFVPARQSRRRAGVRAAGVPLQHVRDGEFVERDRMLGGVERDIRTIAPPTPGAPSNLTASSPVAYEIRTSNGELVANRTGVIPLGTLCGAEFQIVDNVRYYSVEPSDADLVNWPSALANLRLWARCSATAANF